jgi:glutathione S-transferase
LNSARRRSTTSPVSIPPDEASFGQKAGKLSEKFRWLESRLGPGPYFDGSGFSLVDAVFGPVFRYFDVFDRVGEFGILAGKPKVAAWREKLAARSSIGAAVAPDYDARLWAFLHARKSHLSQLMRKPDCSQGNAASAP